MELTFTMLPKTEPATTEISRLRAANRRMRHMIRGLLAVQAATLLAVALVLAA